MRLQLVHYTLQHDDTETRRAEDVAYALMDTPDIASFTDLGGMRDQFRSVCREADYTPVVFDNQRGEAFATRNSTTDLVGKDNVLVGELDGDKAFINWVEAKVTKDGQTEHVFYHCAHWWQTARAERHDAMTQAMCAQVRKHADTNKKLSFFAGDAAVDEGDYRPTARMLRENDLLTIWDEFQVAPYDQGDSIDVLGHYDLDRRATGQRYKVYPKAHSDHRALGVWYDIAVRGEYTDPDTTPDPTDRDYYKPGKRDWSDYFDDSVYPLPQAVDDSGDPRHGGLISD